MKGSLGACVEVYRRALVGLMIPTSLSAAGVTHLFDRLQPLMARIRLPAGFVIAGLIAAAAWDLAVPLGLTATELLLVGVVAVLVGWRDVEPLWVIPGAAAVGLVASLLR